MKTSYKLAKLFLITLFLITSCSEDSVSSSESPSTTDIGLESNEVNGNGENTETGQITAGEWNDIENWSFWTDLLNENIYFETQPYWNFYTQNRLAFQVNDTNSLPVNGALVTLYKGTIKVTEARTDNFGKTNLFVNLHQETEDVIDYENYSVAIDNVILDHVIIPFNAGENQINVYNSNTVTDKIEISFIVDATGSMSDELEFLKNDLQDVISTVQSDNQNASILTSAVFYRDYGDDYLVRQSDFTTDINSTLDFIEQQYAAGGGDFPEAVDVAISTAINDLQWSTNAKTKIAFLLLDAPPHHENQIIENIHETLSSAASNGVKIIPITASGIDKSTEFLMRYMALVTNGTYVFITNDSGIGNDHLEPTVGEYQVEFLNDLMVRLINKYSE